MNGWELLTPEQRRRIKRADRERGCLIALVVVIVVLLFWLLWAFNSAPGTWPGHDDAQLMEVRGRALLMAEDNAGGGL